MEVICLLTNLVPAAAKSGSQVTDGVILHGCSCTSRLYN